VLGDSLTQRLNVFEVHDGSINASSAITMKSESTPQSPAAVELCKKFGGKNLSIGLFGGSFDPPHEGHLTIAKDAMHRFGLDWIWWFVSPQNTLKATPPSALADRIKLCKHMLSNEHKMLVSDLEASMNFQDTIQLITFLQSQCSNKYFWITGSDTLTVFHKWPGWQDMLRQVKMIVYDRPGFLIEDIKHAIAPEMLAAQLDADEFICDQTVPPAWTLIRDKAPNISSTQIRAARL
jgi:nicotinate-nucleotide adenylyltransferase